MTRRKSDPPVYAPNLDNRIKITIEDRFGIVSDTHLGSMHEALYELENIYDEFQDDGIKQVLHAGDLVDGENVYRGQNRYLNIHGYEQQADYAVKKYPRRKDITTYVVAGNHDMSFHKMIGADILKQICSERPDLNYLGMFYARMSDQIDIDITHPAGGGYYSKSYGIQKYLRNNERPEDYPDILVVGHYHGHGYFSDHGVECLMAGSFQYPNEYGIRRGFVGDIGGWMIEIKRDKKNLKRLKVEWRKQK